MLHTQLQLYIAQAEAGSRSNIHRCNLPDHLDSPRSLVEQEIQASMILNSETRDSRVMEVPAANLMHPGQLPTLNTLWINPELLGTHWQRMAAASPPFTLCCIS